MIKQPGFSLVSFFALALCVGGLARGSSFTPLEWQQVVRKHKVALYVGQHKNTTWIRDRNRNFIDDEIEARFHAGDVLNIVVDLNTCLPPERITRWNLLGSRAGRNAAHDVVRGLDVWIGSST